jgi:hypothetical protein
VSELAVQAAESQVVSSQLVGKAGTATGNKKSKGPVVSELAVQAAESQVESSQLVGKAGATTGNKKSKGPVVSEFAVKAAGAVSTNKKSKGKVAVRSTVDQSLGNKLEFDFDGELVEKDGV